MYWIYRTHIYSWRNQPVQAKLVNPAPRKLRNVYSATGYRDPMQNQPYGTDMQLEFQLHPAKFYPDNYFNDAGFQLYSKRLIDLLESFDVRAEMFLVTMINDSDKTFRNHSYFIYHVLEGVLSAIDSEKSGWIDDPELAIQGLVLDYSKFEPRPMFYCDHVYVPLMRDDVKQAIENNEIAGFDFFPLESYQGGKHRYGLNSRE